MAQDVLSEQCSSRNERPFSIYTRGMKGKMTIEIKDENRKGKDIIFGLMFYKFDPMLCRIVRWICEEWSEVIITESYRDKRHKNDLHGVIPVRAIDLRSLIYVKPELVANKINKHWQYDPERPSMKVAVYHDTGEGPHFHVQVHPNTVRIG